MDSWRDIYTAASAEKDPAKQRELVYQAIIAIEERRRHQAKSSKR